MLRWFEYQQVYCPSRVMERDGAHLGCPFEDVFLIASDGTQLHSWFFPARPGAGRARMALLLMHGNAGNISDRLEFCRAWLELGLNVFLFDYRGYGRSDGQPSEAGTYLDAEAAYDWLRQKGFGPANIIALGKSLGGGIASELALRKPLGGLILQSTFTNIPDLAGELFPWLPIRWLSTIKYDTLQKLPRIRIPVLVVHSREDALVRYAHAERNFAAANEPKSLLEISGGHTSVLEAGREDYLRGLECYLTSLPKAK